MFLLPLSFVVRILFAITQFSSSIMSSTSGNVWILISEAQGRPDIGILGDGDYDCFLADIFAVNMLPRLLSVSPATGSSILTPFFFLLPWLPTLYLCTFSPFIYLNFDIA